ncbi:MAG: LLM class flavin-dependent oxidoreductase, partial [Intrasporangium sp.]|uniref:LLM class flavin-dependent oxidoreductase n=1 Tax=Intrasporangium sp. TaxID=1925024 RepID=UPI003F7D6A65
PGGGARFHRLADQREDITGMWATPRGSLYSHPGVHYPVAGSPALAKPVQDGGVPIIIGGGGRRRTPALAARYAAEFNAAFRLRDETARLFAGARAACERMDRDPLSLTLSAAQVVCLGRDEATVRRRAAAIGRDVDELRANGLTGTPDEVVAKLRSFADLGADRIYLQVLDLADLDHLSDIAETVLPHVA